MPFCPFRLYRPEIQCVLLWFCISVAHAKAGEKEVYVQSKEGSIGGGNYSYYSVNHPGRLVVRLDSLTGDADIYASLRHSEPTYLITEHEFSSRTCGVDHIYVPASAKRPLNIGVYGHYNHHLSTFLLRVYIWPHTEKDMTYLNLVPYDLTMLESLTPQTSLGSSGSTSSPDASVMAQSGMEFMGSVLKFVLEVLLELLT